jgi:hypothetical protein
MGRRASIGEPELWLMAGRTGHPMRAQACVKKQAMPQTRGIETRGQRIGGVWRRLRQW